MTASQSISKIGIMELEKELLNAFMAKDLPVIDKLIHDDALFVYPNGLAVTKAMVLDNYRSGNSGFTTINSGEQQISIIDDTAIVSMTLELKGSYFEELISAQFRYIRVWKLCNAAWRVIAVSGVPLDK